MASGSSHRQCLYTVGHGTRSADDIADLLRQAGVTTVIDVRRYPAGRRQPHLSRTRLAIDLPSRGIGYEWWGEALGGRRSIDPESAARSPWRSRSFAAYSAYMATDEFREALARLEARADSGEALALMCAEIVWWRCHRRLIADAVTADGFEVEHIIDRVPGRTHQQSTGSGPARGVERAGPSASYCR
jgi:uncharacterized protein (DUF488 family)